jgi:hypothetical protein
MASIASFTPPVGHLEEKMSQPPLAVGLLVGVDAGTTMTDGSS